MNDIELNDDNWVPSVEEIEAANPNAGKLQFKIDTSKVTDSLAKVNAAMAKFEASNGVSGLATPLSAEEQVTISDINATTAAPLTMAGPIIPHVKLAPGLVDDAVHEALTKLLTQPPEALKVDAPEMLHARVARITPKEGVVLTTDDGQDYILNVFKGFTVKYSQHQAYPVLCVELPMDFAETYVPETDQKTGKPLGWDKP